VAEVPEVPAARREPAASPGLARPLLIAAGLALGPMVALGLARFAYSLLLPAMRSDLQWTLTQAGAMNTANAVGYLVGAIAAGPLSPAPAAGARTWSDSP